MKKKSRHRRKTHTKQFHTIKNARPDLGQPPGTPVYVGEEQQIPSRLTLISYTKDSCDFREIPVENISLLDERDKIHWLNIDGLSDVELLQRVAEHFGIHQLTLEDIMNTEQRPKVEVYDDYIFVAMKMIQFSDSGALDFEQVSFILKDNFVITFQEKVGDVFNPVRERIKTGYGRVRRGNEDYLFYGLLDVMVDYYFFVLEKIGDSIEELEGRAATETNQNFILEIQDLKKDILLVRKSVWPVREIMYVLIRDESPILDRSIAPYLRDLYDHTVQVMDTVETYRDMVSSVMEVNLSILSNKTNEVMKLLTIISTIFIPLTFIVGVYGMNFTYMPELSWRYGYAVVWAIMIAIVVGMVIYFKRKKWL